MTSSSDFFGAINALVRAPALAPQSPALHTAIHIAEGDVVRFFPVDPELTPLVLEVIQLRFAGDDVLVDGWFRGDGEQEIETVHLYRSTPVQIIRRSTKEG